MQCLLGVIPSVGSCIVRDAHCHQRASSLTHIARGPIVGKAMVYNDMFGGPNARGPIVCGPITGLAHLWQYI